MAGNANSQLIRDCDGFAAAKCTPDPDSELGTHPLTTEDDCQAGCLLDAACMDYTWNPSAEGAEKCKWYVDNYRQNCAVYAGSRVSKKYRLFFFVHLGQACKDKIYDSFHINVDKLL